MRRIYLPAITSQDKPIQGMMHAPNPKTRRKNMDILPSKLLIADAIKQISGGKAGTDVHLRDIIKATGKNENSVTSAIFGLRTLGYVAPYQRKAIYALTPLGIAFMVGKTAKG